MIHVHLSGSPYEMGYQHGQALRALVDGMLCYESRRHAHFPAPAFEIGVVLNRVRQVAPDLVEELQGVSDGACVPFDLLLEINLRVLHYCTVMAFVHSEQGPLLGKNLDFPAYAYQALFTVEPDDGYSFTHVGCAGSVASYGGINIVGLAMGHAAVPLEDASNGGDWPVAFLRRHALQHSATTEEALALVSQRDVWRMGDNFLFLDRYGEAAVVEKQPGNQRIRRAENGMLWCSNCFVCSGQVAGSEDGQGRHAHLERLVQGQSLAYSERLLRRLLRSHEGAYPVCRDSTQLSFVAYPASGRLAIADGYPCQVEYVWVN